MNSAEEPIDMDALRKRFPWVGLGPEGEHDLSARYRTILAEVRISHEIVEAIDAIRRSA